MKNWITLALSATFLASCSPWPEPPIPRPGEPGYQGPVLNPIEADQNTRVVTKTKSQTKPISRSKPVSKPDPTPKPEPAPVDKPKPKYPTSTSIPGKDGHVFNPYTNNPVDVRGIPSGSLVTDPNDGEGRKFRVP